jgi:hypothetical protein
MGSDHILIHLDFQRLANDTDIDAFVQQWIATIQDLPDHKHGQMMGWWTTHVGQLAARLTKDDRQGLGPDATDEGFETRSRHRRVFVVYVTLLEWFASGGRQEVWDEYVRTSATWITHRKFFKEFRTYEKKSQVDRSMMVAWLDRGGWFFIPRMAP